MLNDTRDDGTRFVVWDATDTNAFRDAATRAEFMAQIEDDEERSRPARLAAAHLRAMLTAEAARVKAEKAESVAAKNSALADDAAKAEA